VVAEGVRRVTAADRNQLAWDLLHAANRTQAKGSMVRLVFPQAPEVVDELGPGPTDIALLSAVEYLEDHGYLAPADIGLSTAAYTITAAGLAWLEEPLEPPEVASAPDAEVARRAPPLEDEEDRQVEPREALETPVERPEGEEVWSDAAGAQESSEVPWWRRTFGP
jgi:hypothetical protein